MLRSKPWFTLMLALVACSPRPSNQDDTQATESGSGTAGTVCLPSCTVDEDCGEPFAECVEGGCRSHGCGTDADCDPGQICSAFRGYRSCVPACVQDSECGAYSVCAAGGCRPACANDAACDVDTNDHVCEPIEGVPTCIWVCGTDADCMVLDEGGPGFEYECVAGRCESVGCMPEVCTSGWVCVPG